VGFPPLPLLERSFVGVILHVGSVRFDRTIPTPFNVLFPIPSRKSPLLRRENLLTARELEFGTSQRFHCRRLVVVLAPDRHQRLPDVDAGHGSLRFSVRSAHPRLEPIGPGARQHFVDTDDVEGVHSHADVEGVFTGDLGHVLVRADTCRLQRLRGELFVLVRDEVDALGELVHPRLLLAQVEDADFGIWDTATEARFWVRLVFAVAVTACWSSTHGVAT